MFKKTESLLKTVEKLVKKGDEDSLKEAGLIMSNCYNTLDGSLGKEHNAFIELKTQIDSFSLCIKQALNYINKFAESNRSPDQGDALYNLEQARKSLRGIFAKLTKLIEFLPR